MGDVVVGWGDKRRRVEVVCGGLLDGVVGEVVC